MHIYIQACIQPYNRHAMPMKRSRRAGNCTGHTCTTTTTGHHPAAQQRGSHRFTDCPCTGSSSDAESGVLPITSQFHFNQYVVTMRVLIDHNFKYYQQGLWVRTDTEAHGCAPAQNPIAGMAQSCIYVYIHACIQPYNRSRRKRSRRAGNCTGHLCTTVLS